MVEIFTDALVDTAKMVPLLLIIYIAIEYFEYKYSNKMRENVERAGKAGPAIAALTGSFPQCGFSVIISTLYTQRLVTIGTLLAVYLSTSDEAIPVILSQPDKIRVVLPLILTKIALALFVGYLVDLIYRKRAEKIIDRVEHSKHIELGHEHEIDEPGCCGHEIGGKPTVKNFLLHPILHTVKIFFFIFIVSSIINYVFFRLGDDNVSRLFLGHSVFQPFITALVGLIPNCAASVAITEMYLKGAISYGSAIAGLSASGGLGLLILFRDNKNLKNTLVILGLLLFFSISAGVLIQTFYG